LKARGSKKKPRDRKTKKGKKRTPKANTRRTHIHPKRRKFPKHGGGKNEYCGKRIGVRRKALQWGKWSAKQEVLPYLDGPTKRQEEGIIKCKEKDKGSTVAENRKTGRGGRAQTQGKGEYETLGERGKK